MFERKDFDNLVKIEGDNLKYLSGYRGLYYLCFPQYAFKVINPKHFLLRFCIRGIHCVQHKKRKTTATESNFSYAYTMRYLILFAIITICGCTTYPTVDLRTTDRSSMNSVTERELTSIFKLIGFTYNSEAENPYWSYNKFKDDENKILLFYKLDKETLDIRIISRDGESELTQTLGKQLEHLLKKQYPLLKYKYKYFEQSHPFG